MFFKKVYCKHDHKLTINKTFLKMSLPIFSSNLCLMKKCF